LQAADDGVERLLLAPQFLGALLVVPDRGILELAGYFLEALVLGIEVKDTSAAPRTALRGRRAMRRAG
jgi:hypothetical protein